LETKEATEAKEAKEAEEDTRPRKLGSQESQEQNNVFVVLPLRLEAKMGPIRLRIAPKWPQAPRWPRDAPKRGRSKKLFWFALQIGRKDGSNEASGWLRECPKMLPKMTHDEPEMAQLGSRMG
jgi:hypothetical protein